MLAGKLIGSDENLLTSLSWGQRYDQLLHKQNAILSYYYERNGLKISIIPSVSEIYTNRVVFQRDQLGLHQHVNGAPLVGGVVGDGDFLTINAVETSVVLLE